MILTIYTMEWKPLISCTFEGPRFDDGGLDLQDLGSLIILRDLLIETAIEIWREDNPHRERLSPGFEASLRLRFFNLEKNCTTVKIHRPSDNAAEQSYLPGLEPEPDPLDLSSKLEWAAAYVVEAVNGDRVPIGFPERLMSKVAEFSASIPGGSTIELKLLGQPKERIHAPTSVIDPSDVRPTEPDAEQAQGGPSINPAKVSPSQQDLAEQVTVDSNPTRQPSDSPPIDLKNYSEIRIKPAVANEEQGSTYSQAARVARADDAAPGIDTPLAPVFRPITITPPRPTPRPTTAQISSDYTAKIERLIRQPYEDHVDLLGEVTMASLKGRVTIMLPDIGEIDIKFAKEQEKGVTEALHKHESIRLRVIGRGVFQPITGRLQSIIQVYDLRIIKSNETDFDKTAASLIDLADEFIAAIPEDEWKNIPSDAAENIDHYLYGTPKKKRGEP